MNEMPTTGRAIWGALAELPSVDSLYAACERIRDEGYTSWDAHTPYPVHGLERAMGLKRSLVPSIVLALGLGGAAAGMLLQWWVSVEAYPLIISGKPLFSWPAFVPIMFECGVMGGAAGAFFGFLGLARLPRHHHPLFESTAFERASDDAFFVSIAADDPSWDRERTTAFLHEIGATTVEVIEA